MATEIDYSAVLSDLEAKRAAIDSAIAGVRQMLNLGAEQGVGGATSGTSERREQPTSVRFDSFFRMPMSASIVKFLEIAKVPQSVSEVTAALLAGGFKTTSKNLMPIVGSNLSRLKAAGETVNVEGKWGLASWYPAARKAELHAKSKKSSKRKKTKPTATKDQAERQDAPKAPASKPTPEQLEKMKALRAVGKKDGEIGNEFGISALDVFRALKPKSTAA
jgi:hypothetical protein